MSATPPPSAGDERARIYNGRYELTRQIARGGTAQVYLARDLLLDRPVALKVLFPELSSDPSFVERFRREAQAAANLSHPNIVPVFDWGESERTYFIVMEYVNGEPLSSIIRGQAPLPAARAAGIASDIAKALSYAHRHGVVHRDVKPGNVLITRDGQVKVTDFGIARAIGSDDNVTQTGLVMGTATYFSPEQAQGLGVDGRSDVYALGVVLYEMVTGRPPFSADTPVAIAYKHVSEAAVPPRELEPRIPEALEAVIMRAIAKQPADRYPTAEDFHSDLERYAQGAPVLALAGMGGLAGFGATQALSVRGPEMTQAFGPMPTTVLQAGAATAAVSPTVRQRTELVGGAPPRPEMPKRRWLGWAIVGFLLALALAALVFFGGRSLGYFGARGFLSMPDVLQKSLGTATAQLKRDGLHVSSRAQYSDRKKGSVLHQSPAPSRTVQRGTTVRLVYSGGRRTVAVPAVLNEPYQQAEEAIKGAGLKYQLVPVTPTPGAVEGVVTRTDPRAGTQLLPHKTVRIYYIHGTAVVRVPTVVGDSLGQADAAIVSSHLTLKPTTTAPSATVKAGSVAGTSPAAGTSVPVGSGVTVIISSGPPATVPDLVNQGYTAPQAEKLITQAGLVPEVNYVSGLPSNANYVVGQSPAAGTKVTKGSTVTITVVKPLSSTTTTTTLPPPGPTTSTSTTSTTVPTTPSTRLGGSPAAVRRQAAGRRRGSS